MQIDYKKYVGRKFNKDALGCAEIVSEFYPEVAKNCCYNNDYNYIYEQLSKTMVERHSIRIGDILVFTFGELIHLAIYVDTNLILHASPNGWQLSKLNKHLKSLKHIFRKV